MDDREVAKIIRDPIHEYISVYENEIPLLDCALLQRLRNIKQNGTAYYTYPALAVSRFEHSLGVMHLADEMLTAALAKSDDSVTSQFLSSCQKAFHWEARYVRTGLSRIIRITGLLHDLGQLPFSHTFEELIHQVAENIMPANFIEKWQEYSTTTDGSFHEFLTVMLIETDPDIGSALGEDKTIVLKILRAPPEDGSVYGTLHEIVAFDIDADRADYLLRDGTASGAEFGRFDLRRLIAGMRLARVVTQSPKRKESFVIRPTIRALSAIESIVIERYKSYRWLYHHHRVVVTNRILEELIWRTLKYKWDCVSPFDSISLSFPLARLASVANTSFRQAFLDDVDVIGLLRQEERILKEQNGGISALEMCTEFRELAALLDEMLWRKKRGISLWKDIGSYKQFNDQIASAIEAIFVEHQRKEYERTQGRVLPADQVRRTTEKTDFTLNWVVERLLGRSFVKRQELEKRINEELGKKKIDGFILLALTFFKPWEYRGQNEYEVIGRDGSLYHVSDVSPIVKQLKETTRQSIRLYAYLICNREIEALSLSGQMNTMKEMRDTSLKVLAASLIGWVKAELVKGGKR